MVCHDWTSLITEPTSPLSHPRPMEVGYGEANHEEVAQNVYHGQAV